jgi:hypothetical protein
MIRNLIFHTWGELYDLVQHICQPSGICMAHALQKSHRLLQDTYQQLQTIYFEHVLHPRLQHYYDHERLLTACILCMVYLAKTKHPRTSSPAGIYLPVQNSPWSRTVS